MKLLMSGLCALVVSAMPLAADIQNYTAPGNLAPEHDLSCVSVEEVGPEFSPADIALGIADCFRKKRYEDMGYLFLTFKIRGYFDTKRVSDISAHQAITVMTMQLSDALGARFQSKLNEQIQLLTADHSERKARFCASMRASGPPSYEPIYMIQHGMRAFTGGNEEALVQGFDAERVWNEIQVAYVKCS